MTFKLNKVVVCGVGLIGGSFALALKAAGVVGEVVGVGRSQASLTEALKLGVIDRIASDWADAAKDADLILLAAPVGATEAVLRALAPQLAPHTVVTDGGSTKQDVIAAARTALGDKISQFVPAHPIAGAELSGVAAAKADLYQGKRVVLTPLPENPPAALNRVRQTWQACGAQLSELDGQSHDEIFAAVSHLPHVLAFVLVHELAARPNAGQLFSFAAGGFRDFTRIASSHPEMWRDICIANRQALLSEITLFVDALQNVYQMLEIPDDKDLLQLFSLARRQRNAWLGRQGSIDG